MSPVLTQRVAGPSHGVSRALPNCQSQALHQGASVAGASRASDIAPGSSPAGMRRPVEQLVAPTLSPSAPNSSRVDDVDYIDAASITPPSPSTMETITKSSRKEEMIASTVSGAAASARNRPLALQQLQQSPDVTRPAGLAASKIGAKAEVEMPTSAVSTCAASPTNASVSQDEPGLFESMGDISLAPATNFIPLMHAPPSPANSSAPCSPASSVVLSSGACRSSIASAICRFTSSGIGSSVSACGFASNTSLIAASVAANIGGSGGVNDNCPLVNALLGPSEAFRQCFSEFASPPSIQHRPKSAAMSAVATASAIDQRLPLRPSTANRLCRQSQSCADPRGSYDKRGAVIVSSGGGDGDDSGVMTGRSSSDPQPSVTIHDAVAPAQDAPPLLPLSYLAAASLSGCSSRRSSLRDQNSVTIKATTVVKDAAGAIDKILSRGVTALVTALRSSGPPYNTPYDSLNQAVKAIAVARQYTKETGPEDAEVTFLPFYRYDTNERPDPYRFAFLVFPVPHLNERLKTVDETVLNVARGSDVHKMASAIIAVMLDRGQAVMKAAGSEAIFVAMSAVVNARHRLIAKHGFDLMLAAAWITEDTINTMGRESKFLRFNVLRTEPAGPKSRVLPTLPLLVEAC